MVELRRQPRLPLTLCTIYNGSFPDPDFQQIISTAVMVFNDVILRVAIEFGIPVIDLRFVCSSPADYANPIELRIKTKYVAASVIEQFAKGEIDDAGVEGVPGLILVSNGGGLVLI